MNAGARDGYTLLLEQPRPLGVGREECFEGRTVLYLRIMTARGAEAHEHVMVALLTKPRDEIVHRRREIRCDGYPNDVRYRILQGTSGECAKRADGKQSSSHSGTLDVERFDRNIHLNISVQPFRRHHASGFTDRSGTLYASPIERHDAEVRLCRR